MNVIARIRYDLVSGMKYSSEHDAFTDLPNRSAFFAAVRRLPADCPGKRFAMVCMDIVHFAACSFFCGEEESGKLLFAMADWPRQRAGRYQPRVYGRISGDAFCICAPNHAEIIPEEAAKIYKEIA